MNLNHDVVYRCLRRGPLHQLHSGRSRSLVRHHDCLHGVSGSNGGAPVTYRVPVPCGGVPIETAQSLLVKLGRTLINGSMRASGAARKRTWLADL